MRPTLVGAAIASSVLLFSPHADAQTRDTYVAIAAGAVNLRDAELEYEGNPDRYRFASFDNGYLFSGALGRSLGENFRVEGEIAYRANDESFIMPGEGGHGTASSLAFMGNVYWDAPVDWALRPYAGFGLGAAQVTHEGFVVADIGVPERTLSDDSGWAFAYQAMLGARREIGDDWIVGGEYRYFSAAEPKIDDLDGFTYDTDYDSHALLISLARRL